GEADRWVRTGLAPPGTYGREGPGSERLVSAGTAGGLRLPVRVGACIGARAGHGGGGGGHRVASVTGVTGVAGGVAEVDRAEFVGALGVLGDVDAGHLVLHRDPEAHRLVDDLAEDPGDGEGVEADRDRPEGLHPELRDTAAVEQSLALPGEQRVRGQEAE